MKKMLAVVCSALALTGCKVDLDTTVNTDDLQSTEFKIVEGNLRFEVATCTNYEDSRKDSNSLIQVKEKVPAIFKDAKFVECYKQKFDSFAVFTIPVGVGKLGDNSMIANTDINIISAKNVPLAVDLDENAVKRLKSAEKDIMSKLDFNMNITVQKGSGDFMDGLALSSFVTNSKVKNKPVLVSNYSKDSFPMTLRLSNVSMQTLMQDGRVPVLVTSEFLN